MKIVLLGSILLTAVFFDLRSYVIPNPLIVCGFILSAAYQWSANGLLGAVELLTGALIPLVMLGGLHYFRMLGAGDIKLLMVTGSFLGLKESLQCVFLSFLFAAVYAAALLIRYRIWKHRLIYFLKYFQDYRKTKCWRPYITEKEKEGYLHFSIPVCLAGMFLAIIC